MKMISKRLAGLFPALLIFSLLLTSVICFADDVVAVTPPTGAEWGALIQALGGLKGAGILAIVAVVIQALMFFFRTSLADFAGKWKIVIVTGLSLIGGVVGLRLTGVDWLAAIVNSGTLAAAQVFAHQLITQLTEPPKSA